MKHYAFLGKPHNFNYENTKFTEKFIISHIQKERDHRKNREEITVIQPVQTHSNRIIEITEKNKNNLPEFFDCDGLWTQENNIALSIKTGDCMALVFTHKTENIIANIHAGWRGVGNKIASQFLQNFSSEINEGFEVYFSPSLLSCCCEFTNPYEETPAFFHECITEKISQEKKKYFVNLQEIITKELLSHNIQKENIFYTNICTQCTNDFWSHRCKEKERNVSYVMQSA